ncbi:MAG: hypothetical protein IPF99_30100 [Deltaproteobacteria bacterium]|nr:hypothetical protein [Deltaproteobacteria bacterium]
MQAANELWSLLQPKPRDRIVANRGKREVLGVGEVEAPGYVWQPERTSFRHTVRVRWDTSRARRVDEQSRWFRTIVRLDATRWTELLGLTALPERVEAQRPARDPTVAPPPSLEVIRRHLDEVELRIDARTLRRYHVALQVRRFVVLAGVSGTGKTWLAREYANAVGAIWRDPVAPDWTSDPGPSGLRAPAAQRRLCPHRVQPPP